ncbi:MAG: polymerase [Treponema sp.]|jgi:hypothetical protein|nr:polymerase [Treponema sp.]
MKRGCITGILVWIAVAVTGQTKIDISGMIEWERMELNATVTLNLASAGIKLPAGRSQAEEFINIEYVNLILPYILAIPVDSSDTIENLINRGEFSLRLPSFIADTARKIPPALSADLASLSVAYTIDLTNISSRLIRHSRAMELPRPLTPVPAAEYSGIIIIASEEMPVHGRNSAALTEPCIFPKVWDTNMNLIYNRNILDPDTREKTAPVMYVSESSVFRPTPSGLSPELAELVGTNPLRIIARGVFGARPTDPVIDREDALIILSTEANRRLLREGRVAFALNEKTLKNPLK